MPPPASGFISVCRPPASRVTVPRLPASGLSDGRHLPADLVVVGVGVLPNVELAAEAGLPVASGIIVDEQLLTSDPDVFGAWRLRAVRQSAFRRLAED